ncbi:MAG: DUF3368 domain-containing protein [Chloroflexi bacterium]|nr:DUF3368 domain-containing protein [Chloroflexota bacterium]
MIVVSNTSPLTNLAAIGQFALLHDLFGHLHVPTAVVHELAAGGKSWPGSAEVASATWITTHPIQNQTVVDALRLDLDWGESEALALAIELKADLVLLDEQTARYAAQLPQYAGDGCCGVVGAGQNNWLIAPHPSSFGCVARASGLLSQRGGLPRSLAFGKRVDV